MFYAALAEVVYIAKLTNKYILLKYNCTAKFLVAVVVYIIKQLFYSRSSYMRDSRPGATIDNLRNGLETQAKVYATSVIRFTLEPCKFTLNTFQDSVFTYFKQEQKCEWNYRLLKLLRGINKAKNHHLMFP